MIFKRNPYQYYTDTRKKPLKKRTIVFISIGAVLLFVLGYFSARPIMQLLGLLGIL